MKSRLKRVPDFMLYGESGDPQAAEHLHVEDIQARSRRYLWEIAPHTHRGLYQCLFVAEGPAAAHVDDSHAQLTGPALVILPPGCVHAFNFSAATEGHVLTVAPEVLFEGSDDATRLSFEALFAVPHVLSLEPRNSLAARLQPLFLRLTDEYRAPEGHSSPVCIWLARSILWLSGQELHRRHELDNSTHRAHQSLTRFQALLELHFPDHWPIARYARMVGMSEGRLNRLCRAQRARSAFELLQERLLRESRRRLAYVGMSVAQVARELGFRDPAYFCRFFKRHTGLSPSRFRQHHLREASVVGLRRSLR
jgi:AraC family transcriptional regulator, transcriptional activator of pobA